MAGARLSIRENFEKSDRFTLLTKTGIAVLDRDLEITECNQQFEKIFPNLKNFHELEHTKDCEYFVTKIMNNFVKCEEPRFEKIIELNGSYFEIECICFSDMKESLEFDTNQVTSCVVITRDITCSVRSQQIIEREHRNISEMLSKILPHQIVEDIDNGGNRLSFSAHLVTIGDISFTPIFDEQPEISGQSSKLSLSPIDEKSSEKSDSMPKSDKSPKSDNLSKSESTSKSDNVQKSDNVTKSDNIPKSDKISSDEKQKVPENLSSNKLNLNDDKNDIYNLISQRSAKNEEIPQQNSRKSIYQLNDSTKTEISSQNSKLSINGRKPVFAKPNLDGKGITKYQSSGLIMRKKDIDMKDIDKLEKVQNFNSKMICVLDEYISKYKTLSKVKSFMNNYNFCGGLFMSVNKPVEHAEESVRFCLEILRDHDKIQKIVGFDFVFQIGLHTGGPVIAGITSLDYPMFSLLSNVSDLPILMRDKCDENTIKVTRAVYELIFSFGFQISESQNVKHGDVSIPAYTIVL